MEPLDGPSVLARLERAELAARERQLAAAAESDRILAEARERAAAIDAASPARVQAALERLRSDLHAAADAQIAQLERQVGDGGTPPRDAATEARMAAAVELVVAAVLGEPPQGSGPVVTAPPPVTATAGCGPGGRPRCS